MIYIDDLYPKYLINKNIRDLKEYGCKFVDSSDTFYLDDPKNYYVSWGENKSKIRHSVIETGFFRNSVHLDSIGLYERASFNFPISRKIIEEYQAPLSWEKINNIRPLLTKFPQNNGINDWNHFVVICQNPKDRSIWRAGSSGDYYDFLEKTASYYKNKLLLKIHPVTLQNKEEQKRLEEIAIKNNCELHNTDISVINNCEAVLIYNSTFVVDAISKNKHVYQYAPGYFWQSGVVQYTNRNICNKKQNLDKNYNIKFLEFLLWKYCFPETQSTEKLLKIINCFKNSNELFPLPEDCSYAQDWIKDSDVNRSHTPSHLGGHCNVTHVDEGVLNYLKKTFNVESLLDIGCGPGDMKLACEKLNISWKGIDGDKNCKNNYIINHDYTLGCLDHGNNTYDVGWSVEFLEHVEEKYIKNFMNCFSKCNIICVTHALPGKAGHHHVNCQFPEYWIKIFKDYGFEYSEEHTLKIRENSTMIREFMRKNGLIFIKK